jgi:hypothetical protein
MIMMTGRRVVLLDLISQGMIDEVREEVEKGCDVDEKDYIGSCAVLKCVEDNEPDILEILIKAGANVKVNDPLGNSALSLAKKYGYQTIVQMIENAIVTEEQKKEISTYTAKESHSSLKGGLRFYDNCSPEHEDELKSVKPEDELKEGKLSPIAQPKRIKGSN